MNPPVNPPTCEERTEDECTESLTDDKKKCEWSDNSCKPEPEKPKDCDERTESEE
jgi:hypothetical protein